MSFSLEGIEQLNLSTISRRFSSFLKEEDKLPFCRARFFQDSNGRNAMLTSKKKTGSVNSFVFYDCDDGLLMSDGKVLVHSYDGFSHTDVIIPSAGSTPETDPIVIANLLMHSYRYTAVNSGGMLLHSAAVVHDGEAIAFCGLPGAGKSTQAHLWVEYAGAKALNLDQPYVFFEGGVARISGTPFSGKEDCYVNEHYPLKAIFFIIQAAENSVSEISRAEAFSLLYLNNYLFPINSSIEEKNTDIVCRLSQAVPVYKLNCTISPQAVSAAMNVAFPDKTEEGAMTYKVKDEYELRRVADEYVLIVRGSGVQNNDTVMVFNEPGAFLYSELGSPLTESELCSRLTKKYGIDADTAAADVAVFIEKMTQSGLLAQQ